MTDEPAGADSRRIALGHRGMRRSKMVRPATEVGLHARPLPACSLRQNHGEQVQHTLAKGCAGSKKLDALSPTHRASQHGALGGAITNTA